MLSPVEASRAKASTRVLRQAQEDRSPHFKTKLVIGRYEASNHELCMDTRAHKHSP